ncbi:SAM-dependent methyltransferase [Amycolatopsis antarctica]|uniref:SAM-dependent methyltransferase n=1 Tax=Amycolatopsis antarctica TaxID=1854586 RepID=A0A263CXW3_9PSEU|nr:class I SAM-dependent methyltransferase [Amycolatopsis antarctica]OZM69935.1 SAM-dependent methyltransferase [Amycolatopsis antarctica]
MVAVSAHTHDDVDWASRLPGMLLADALEEDALAGVARRLVDRLGGEPTVLDLGSGSGGMSAALAQALAERDGGTVVLVDAVPELLDAAGAAARASVGESAAVRVESVLADAADPGLRDLVPEADLIWASAVVHHLPDQQRAIDDLARILRPGGTLAVAEGGLGVKTLPWDLGVGAPGLEPRLHAARDLWFRDLRASMPGAVQMPYGWNHALGLAGLADVGAFTYLVDHPAPAGDGVRHDVLERLGWFRSTVGDRLDETDRATFDALLDPAGEYHLGRRDDLFLLSARTVHCGRSR